MSPALNAVFHEPDDFDELDVILHYDDDDVHAAPVCLACHRRETSTNKLIPCSQCKTVFYCDVVCASDNWSNCRRGQPGSSHKDVCAALKRANKRRPAMQAIAKQFPWAHQREDGSFVFDRYRASRGLFGCGSSYGYWTEAPCACDTQSDYIWGFQLLEEDRLDEREAWKLPKDEIPSLESISTTGSHLTPPNFSHSWTSYYEWRCLPMRSPAALLLHWPLSVYRLLSLLHCVPPVPPAERRTLTIHLLGVEKELDFLPIFGELALLIPNTDIELVLFGPGVFRLLLDAEEDEDCLASQQYVYTYTAPQSCGGSTLRISLSDSGPIWGDISMDSESGRPHAMIALNARLATYSPWQLALLASRAFNVPFAVTESQEVDIELAIKLLKSLPKARRNLWSMVELEPEEEKRIAKTVDSEFIWGMNPFMCPGPKPRSFGGGPLSINGFELVVTPGTAEPN